MLFEVRILDSNGNMKKQVSPRELSLRHWKSFGEAIDFAFKGNPRAKISKLKTRKTPQTRAS